VGSAAWAADGGAGAPCAWTAVQPRRQPTAERARGLGTAAMQAAGGEVGARAAGGAADWNEARERGLAKRGSGDGECAMLGKDAEGRWTDCEQAG